MALLDASRGLEHGWMCTDRFVGSLLHEKDIKKKQSTDFREQLRSSRPGSDVELVFIFQ